MTSIAQQLSKPVVAIFVSGSIAEVTDLKRTDEGNTLTLRGIYTNKSSKDIRLDVSELSLVDFKNKKKYLVITVPVGPCICSTQGSYPVIQQGESTRFWAKIAAPPEAVTAMSLVWGSAEPVLIPITN